MKFASCKTLLATSVASVLASVSSVANAQDNDGVQESAEETSSNIIIVSAQKRDESLQEVPLAITAIGGETLEDRGVTDITSLDSSVPGLSVGSSGSDARPSIRGVITNEVDLFNDPTIGFFVDGVYKARTSQGLAAFVDLERVEVLRGPQGTLFGRNTYGGSISLVTKKPQFDFGVEGSLQYANYNDLRGEAALNVPIGPDTAVRFVGVYQESDGYVNTLTPRNGLPTPPDFNDNDQWYVRGTFLHSTGPGELQVTYSHWDQGGYGAGGYGYTVAGALRNAAGVLDLGGTLDRNNPRGGFPGPSDTGPYDVYRNTALERDVIEDTLTIQASVDIGAVTLRSISGWSGFKASRVGDEDFSESNTNYFLLETGSDAFSQELQLVSNNNSSPLQYVFGLFYFNESGREDFTFTFPSAAAPGGIGLFDFRQEVDTDSYAGFGQIEYTIGDALTLIAGGRYTEDHKRFRYTRPIAQGTPDRDVSDVFDKFTWNLGAQYELSPDNMVYASISTGFRSGGTNNSEAPVPNYGPQTITAYEVGSKNTFANGAGIVNISVYYNDLQDILSNTSVVIGPTQIVARSNAGSSHAFGAELEFAYDFDNGLNIFGNVAYLDAKYDAFQISLPSGYGLASGYKFVPGTTNQLDLAGYEVPLSPKFTATLGASYEIDFGGFTLTPAAMTYISADYYANEYNYDGGTDTRTVGRQPSYTKTDLSLTFETIEETFMVQAFVRNIENEAILNRTTIGGGGAIYQNYSKPRTYGVKAGFKF